MLKQKLVLILAMGLSASAPAGIEETISELIPRLAASTVEDRYEPQMKLQALAVAAARPGAEPERLAFASVLAAKAGDAATPRDALVWLVRQLEYIGAAESVPALARLLKSSDAELQETARRALEKNSSPEATTALRHALATGGTTDWIIGLVQSIGEKRDAAAVQLIFRVADQDAARPAALAALGKIADPAGVKALWEAYSRNWAGAGAALVAAADRIAAAKDHGRAAAIDLELYLKDKQPATRASALIGLARVDGVKAKELIPAALSSSETQLRTAAVMAGRIACGQDAPETFARLFPGLDPAAKVMVLREFRSASEKQLLGMAAEPDEQVRLAAVETLGRIGTTASVPFLVKCSADGQPPASGIAEVALSRLNSPGIDAALVKLAGRADPAFRASAIRALARRQYYPAAAKLLPYMYDTNQVIRAAALSSVATLGGEAELEPLARQAVTNPTPEASAALQTLAGRCSDKARVSRLLLELVRTAPAEGIGPVCEVLSVVGGPDSIDGLAALAASETETIRDSALRALAGSPDYLCVKPLLELARNPRTSKVHQVLALQGIARLVRSADDQPAQTRLDAARAMLEIATRQEERLAALTAAAGIPDPQAGALILKYVADPQLGADAARAAISLSETLWRPDRKAAREVLQNLLRADLPPEIKARAEAALKR